MNRPCPACGGKTYVDHYENFALEAYCPCGWEEGGPDDHGYLTMDERPSAPPGAGRTRRAVNCENGNHLGVRAIPVHTH
jgi:hypothetical protein